MSETGAKSEMPEYPDDLPSNRDVSQQDGEVEEVECSLSLSRAWMWPYVKALSANGGIKKDAATSAGVSLRNVQIAKLKDDVFAAAEQAAILISRDHLESVIHKRAIEGDTVEIHKPDGTIIKKVEYDSYLQIRLAERLERGTWSQRQQIEHSIGEGTFQTLSDRRQAMEAVRRDLTEAPLSLNKGNQNCENAPAVIEIEPISTQVTDNQR